MKIAVASGKGGTGKTTLATNLASFLAEEEPLVLVDLDVEAPNSGLFIKGELLSEEARYRMIPAWKGETCKLCGNCQEVCNYNAVIRLDTQIIVFSQLCHSCYACSELCPSASLEMEPRKMGMLRHFRRDRLEFIESRLEIGQEQASPLISSTKEYLDSKYPRDSLVIFDAPPGTSCPVIEAVKGVDLVILVTEPTPFGLHDLKLAVETMRALGMEHAVVINRDGIGNEEASAYCNQERIPVLARIPNERRIAELYSRGKLVYRENQAMKKQLEGMWDYISRKYRAG